MTAPLTPPADAPDLDNLSRLEAAATPGPWDGGGDWVSAPDPDYPDERQYANWANESWVTWCDNEFIAAARNALPALLADHARLVAEVARLRGLVDWHRSQHCLDCEGPLEPCQCQPDCPGGQCARKCHTIRKEAAGE